MSVQTGNKLNHLARELPEGLLVDAPWLEQRGYYRSLRAKYVANGWLEQTGRGVFRRPRGTPGWEQVIISLQTLLQLPVSVGGRTALEIQGYAHYLTQSAQTVHLYSDSQLPGWVARLPLGTGFVCHNRSRILPQVERPSEKLSLTETGNESSTVLPGALRVTRWGQWNWPMVVSTQERAILELIDELPTRESFHNVDMMMEGLVNISPRRMQGLLEQTKSVKVKRLFFFFADRHRHRWLHSIQKAKIDFGAGKRMLVKGGMLDPTYQITVPGDLDAI